MLLLILALTFDSLGETVPPIVLFAVDYPYTQTHELEAD